MQGGVARPSGSARKIANPLREGAVAAHIRADQR
jgi:hypothetical protein